MLTSQKVKEFAKTAGADIIGVASIDRFEDAPVEMHPCSIFPETKSVVVLGCRLLKGSFRGIKEGTEWSSYWIYGYGAGIYGALNDATFRTRRFIESFGWDAVEVPGKATLSEIGPERPPVAPGKLPPDVTISMRLAAAAAGLGELGHSKVFLTPEFGPRQRFAIILTDAELEPDPIYEGKLCDDCMRCVARCPARAIGKEKTISVEIEGRTFSWADLDYGKCKLTHWGFNKEASPFMAKDLPGLKMDIADQTMTWREAFDFGWTLSKEVEYISLVAKGISEVEQPGRPGTICGARGCIQACAEHFEKKRK
ncbi:MAG: hypothetical protein GX977_03995 [Firmicutes bacterium]|nr:hypothetical protein [Bacillota bacterium]